MVEEHPDKNFQATYSIEEFVNAIEKPRRIMLMVKAGPATDATIQELLPHLDKGDILMMAVIRSSKTQCDVMKN